MNRPWYGCDAFVGCDGGVPDAAGVETGPADVAPPDAPPSGGYEAQSYELVGRFDWQQRKLVGRERVTLNATSGGNFAQLDSAVDVKKVTAEDGSRLPFVVLPNVLHVDVSSFASSRTFSFFVEYEASTSDALMSSASRDDDPGKGRVVYTDSEPTAGMKWLPAVHEPSDRAEFSIELTVAANEEERTRWQDFFLARSSDARSASRFSNVWRGVVGLRDERALLVVAEKLHTVPLRDDVQNSVVCDAYRLAQSTPARRVEGVSTGGTTLGHTRRCRPRHAHVGGSVVRPVTRCES